MAMLLNITDTGFLPALPRLAPNMERAILLREVKLQRERDAKVSVCCSGLGSPFDLRVRDSPPRQRSRAYETIPAASA